MVGLTENHVDTADPVVMEGDAILPSLLSRPTVHTRTSHGQIQAVFLVEPVEDALLAHMDVRYRLRVRYNATQLRAMAQVRWLHGRWLAEEARRYELPVVELRRLPDARPTDCGGLERRDFPMPQPEGVCHHHRRGWNARNRIYTLGGGSISDGARILQVMDQVILTLHVNFSPFRSKFHDSSDHLPSSCRIIRMLRQNTKPLLCCS
jgi:hypothetical protein